MYRIRLKEAEAYYTANNEGKKIGNELAQALFPDCSENQRRQSMSKLRNSHRKTIKPEEAHIICQYTGVDMNFLFGF